jgi:hypothetical protein
MGTHLKKLIILFSIVIISSFAKEGSQGDFEKIVFRIKTDQIQALATGLGNCIVSNKIVIDGKKIMYMYLDTPKDENDSGWRFYSGDEDDEYLKDPANTQIFDVNLVANYDPAIIPFLDSPEHSLFKKDENTGEFEEEFLFEFSS